MATTALLFSFSSQVVWAQSPKTADGREFSKLTETEVDALSRPEKKTFYSWKNSQLDATHNRLTIENKQLDEKNKQLDEKNKELVEELLLDFDKKMLTFENLQKWYKEGKLSSNEASTYLSIKRQLQNILRSRKPERAYQALQSSPKYIELINRN